MHVNMHIHTSLCVYMIHIYIYLSTHIFVYIFIHTLHAWMYMWVYKSIQIIYIMYRYTCHGCKCMMMRMCMLTCMHALVYHMHQTTIGFARECVRARMLARMHAYVEKGQVAEASISARTYTPAHRHAHASSAPIQSRKGSRIRTRKTHMPHTCTPAYMQASHERQPA